MGGLPRIIDIDIWIGVRSMGGRSRAFTLIELLVVIAVVVVLLAILLPSLGRARAVAQRAACLGNLRQLAIGTVGYLNDNQAWFPSPVTTVSESSGWYTALDRYLAALRPDDASRSGVAGQRAYRKHKECVVWSSFPTDPAKPPVNTNQTIKEFSRTIKMNTHLRRVGQYFASAGDIQRAAEHVLFGDGTALDQIPWPANTFETGQFSMDINDKKEAGVAIRHDGAANIAFVDGHAESLRLVTYQRPVGATGIQVPAWQGEFLDGSGKPVYGAALDGAKSMEAQKLRRNPAMPLVWSEPGRLYRP
jgi:prepilin-type processing-associated H-X9-DG protein/prepilin-type N-terminal cleavage/methylation domain-containing protein